MKKTKTIDSDVFCIKCGQFLGMTCDPFRPEFCRACFPGNVIDFSKKVKEKKAELRKKSTERLLKQAEDLDW